MLKPAKYIGPWAMAFGYLSALVDFEDDGERYFPDVEDGFASAVRFFGEEIDRLLLDLGSAALDAAVLITFGGEG